jgi:HK97 family phage prohead protease
MKQNLYNLKSGFEVKDLDIRERKVAVYLSKFDSLDSDFDIIRKGAFTKSLQERGVDSSSNRKIAFLRHHDWEKQIGKFLELKEDDYGLFAVGQLGRSTMGEDALRDYEDGIIKEHSIGFQYIKDKMNFVEDKSMKSGGFHEIKELKLYEGSAVTFGSNEFTHVVDVKGENKSQLLERLRDDLNVCIKALSSGKGTDERLHNIEMKVKHLTAQLIVLAGKESDSIVHSLPEEPQKPEEAFKWDDVLSGLHKKAETYSDYPQKAKENAKRGIRLNEEVKPEQIKSAQELH